MNLIKLIRRIIPTSSETNRNKRLLHAVNGAATVLLASSVNDHVGKPLDFDDVLSKIRRYINR